MEQFLLSVSMILRMTRQGLPAAIDQSGISFVTTTSGADHNVISDVDAWTHDGISAQPDIVPDGNFLPVFEPGIAGIRMDRMSGCIDPQHSEPSGSCHRFLLLRHPGSYSCNWHKIFPDFNMGAVIAVKRRIDPGIFGFP